MVSCASESSGRAFVEYANNAFEAMVTLLEQSNTPEMMLVRYFCHVCMHAYALNMLKLIIEHRIYHAHKNND